jgi:hypothetical protein
MFIDKYFRQAFLAVSVVAASFLVTIDAHSSSSRAAAFVMNYDNVTDDEVISIYKDAYTKSGFNFFRQTKRRFAERKDVAFITSLEFEFPIPNYPSKKNGYVIYAIWCGQWRDGSHSHCSVSLDTVFVGGKDYTDDEREIARAQLELAHSKAREIIKEKLGKSFPSELSRY